MRYWMFCQKKPKNESLPPTTDSLRQHIDRANYQTGVWKRTLEAMVDMPPPVSNGWTLTDGHLEPTLMCKDPAPLGLLELTPCKCEKSACKRTAYCVCKANELPCTESCQCMGDDECQNPYKGKIAHIDDEDDDDDNHDDDDINDVIEKDNSF